MEVRDLAIAGPKLVIPRVFSDARGFFLETWQRDRFAEHGIDVDFVQDNHSLSRRGTVRGLHFQRGPGQAKLVRVVRGRIFDVAVDIRPGSPTVGRWVGVELDAHAHHQLFLPTGFAHGFQVLSDEAEVLYKVSTPYDAVSEAGFQFDDPDVGVNWPLAPMHLSPRDQAAPTFAATMKERS
ncbi:MAG: dTDP-4-dehydrorhamnose 3,5-epimerase [Deltaproteobacteria bacterium]|nr:dTDP-4-dehydrorhamnose 3,5-epimerase [Deltaproteobacteria bacterium]